MCVCASVCLCLQSTNEYRVHLGSGYYVHCTAFQAREILNRRLQRVTQQAEASRKLVSEQEGRLKVCACMCNADMKRLP